jgi:outer membrane protein OmpA-like peptidoglycan-associated protein
MMTTRPRRKADEAEKPFWISYADLMTSLMVLFLVAMSVALIAVSKEIADQYRDTREMSRGIDACEAGLRRGLKQQADFDLRDHVIRFREEQFLFDWDKDTLGSADQETRLRRLARRILQVAQEPACERWLKRVVVEGFASDSGTYLHNLNLSYRRSQRILCVLLNPNAPDNLSQKERSLVRSYFFPGGSSFNTRREEASKMQRVELKLEFRGLRDPIEQMPLPKDDYNGCPNDRS